MRRFLACFLVLLMLPASVLAQGAEYRWTLDMPQDALVDLAHALRELFPVEEDNDLFTDVMLRGAAKMADGLEVVIHAQDGLADAKIRLSESDILGATALMAEDAVNIVVDGLNGIVLSVPAMDTAAAQVHKMNEALSQDWLAFGAAVDGAVQSWAETLPTAFDSGSYAGEAYKGGLFRMTYQADDRDLLVLTESLLRYGALETYEPALEEICALLGMEWQQVVDQVCAVAHEAAMRNDYTYVVHSVSDGEYLVGMSVLVFQRGHQVATLSLGWPDEGFKAVLGYGYEGRNVYFAADMNAAQWQLQMVADDELNGYTAACQQEENVLLRLSGHTQNYDGQSAVQAELTGKLMSGLHIAAEIFVDVSLSDMEVSSKLHVNGKELLGQMLRVNKAADVPMPDMSGRRVVEVLSDGTLSQSIDQELERFIMMLGVQIFKVLPVELLTTELDVMDLFQ